MDLAWEMSSSSEEYDVPEDFEDENLLYDEIVKALFLPKDQNPQDVQEEHELRKKNEQLEKEIDELVTAYRQSQASLRVANDQLLKYKNKYRNLKLKYKKNYRNLKMEIETWTITTRGPSTASTTHPATTAPASSPSTSPMSSTSQPRGPGRRGKRPPLTNTSHQLRSRKYK